MKKNKGYQYKNNNPLKSHKASKGKTVILSEEQVNLLKERLNEGISPIVYHFTSIQALYKILLSQKFYLKTGVFRNSYEHTLSDGKRVYYFSTTRNKNANEGYSNGYKSEGCVRITLDGEKLSQKYKGKPTNYWGDDSALGRMKYLNPDKVGRPSRWDDDMRQHRYDETEDRIWSFHPTIPNVMEYIKRVDIFIPNENIILDYEARIEKAREEGKEEIVKALQNKINDRKEIEQELKPLVADVYSLLRGRGIIFLYDNEKDFALGNNNTVKPEWLEKNDFFMTYSDRLAQNSLKSNIYNDKSLFRELVCALAIMVYNEKPDDRKRFIIQYCKQYGFQNNLNKTLFDEVNRRLYWNPNIFDISSEIGQSSRINNEESSKVQDMVTHWMRKNGYRSLRDVIKEGKEIKKVRQGMIAYENAEPDFEIGFETPDASSYAHVVNESAGDLEYHYTDLKGILGMMETDTFNLRDYDDVNRAGKYYMSLTRMRSSAEGYGYGMHRNHSPLFRIELDGRKLNNIRNVNIQPYDYVYNNYENIFDEDERETNPRVNGRKWGGESAEAEDSLTLKDGSDQIVDAVDYIRRIDVLLGHKADNERLLKKFWSSLKTYGDWAEKMHFFSNVNDFNYQRNEISQEDILNFYNGINENKNLNESPDFIEKVSMNYENEEAHPFVVFKGFENEPIVGIVGGETHSDIMGMLYDDVHENGDDVGYFNISNALKDAILNKEIRPLLTSSYYLQGRYYEESQDVKFGGNIISFYDYDLTSIKKDYHTVINILNVIKEHGIPVNIETVDFDHWTGNFAMRFPLKWIGNGIIDSVLSYAIRIEKKFNTDKPLYVIYAENGKMITVDVDFNVVQHNGSNINEDTKPEDVDLSSLKIQKKLNPKFWKNNKLDSRVRLKLLDIADDFCDYLKVDWVNIDDITMTGSLSNYTWNEEYSDIDVHIILDYKKVDERTDFVKEYFKMKKDEWNEKHKDLKIYGYPIEVYVQDKSEPHASSGIFSLEKNEWVIEPDAKKFKKDDYDEKNVRDKVADYMNKIDDLDDKFNSTDDSYHVETIHDDAEELFGDIKKERQDAFTKSKKEFSDGNVIFKTLRRNGYIDKVVNLKDKSYDKMNSINEGNGSTSKLYHQVKDWNFEKLRSIIQNGLIPHQVDGEYNGTYFAKDHLFYGPKPWPTFSLPATPEVYEKYNFSRYANESHIPVAYGEIPFEDLTVEKIPFGIHGNGNILMSNSYAPGGVNYNIAKKKGITVAEAIGENKNLINPIIYTDIFEMFVEHGTSHIFDRYPHIKTEKLLN